MPGAGQTGAPSRPNPALIKALARARLWKEKLISGEAILVRALGEEAGLSERYVARILRLDFLASDIIEAILDGRQPLDLDRLLKGFPLSWAERRRALAFIRS